MTPVVPPGGDDELTGEPVPHFFPAPSLRTTLQLDREPAVMVCLGPENVQEHGLAHAAQPGEDHSPVGAAQLGTGDQEVEGLDFRLAAAEDFRAQARAGAVGVGSEVHAGNSMRV